MFAAILGLSRGVTRDCKMRRISNLPTRRDKLKERIELSLIASAAAAAVVLFVFGVIVLLDAA
jgi:hypothetical protein